MFLYYILVLISPMPNHPLFEEPFAGLTVVKWLGIFCCGYACYRMLAARRVPTLFASWETRCFLMLFGIITLSYFTASNTNGLTFSPMASLVSYVLLFLTTLGIVNTYERLHSALLASIAGAAIASLYVIREFQASGGTNLRPGYIAGDSNYFATCTLLVMPLAVYFAQMKGHRMLRWMCAVSLVLMLIAFTLASSRGGLVGLCVTIAYMVVTSGHSRRKALLIAALVLPMLLLSPASPLSRMLHPDYGDDLGAQVRRDFWRVGFDMIRNHPITGIGLGNFTAQSFSTTPGAEDKHGLACNTFLELAAELGIPGLLAYCGIVAGALYSSGRLRSEGRKRNDLMLQYTGQALQAGLLGFSAAAVFVSAQYQKPFWVMVALTATVPALLRRKSREQKPVAQRNGAPVLHYVAGDLRATL